MYSSLNRNVELSEKSHFFHISVDVLRLKCYEFPRKWQSQHPGEEFPFVQESPQPSTGESETLTRQAGKEGMDRVGSGGKGFWVGKTNWDSFPGCLWLVTWSEASYLSFCIYSFLIHKRRIKKMLFSC